MTKKFRLILVACIIITSILGFIFPNPHPHFWWQRIPIFNAVFGFLGCFIIILASKWLGRKWLIRDEDYYD